jgi:hypothetical protein
LSFVVVVVAAAGRERRESLLMMRFGLAVMSALFDRREYSGEIRVVIIVMMGVEDKNVAVGKEDMVSAGIRGVGLQIDL